MLLHQAKRRIQSVLDLRKRHLSHDVSLRCYYDCIADHFPVHHFDAGMSMLFGLKVFPRILSIDMSKTLPSSRRYTIQLSLRFTGRRQLFIRIETALLRSLRDHLLPARTSDYLSIFEQGFAVYSQVTSSQIQP